jgi:seryl-tRNA synthetase
MSEEKTSADMAYRQIDEKLKLIDKEVEAIQRKVEESLKEINNTAVRSKLQIATMSNNILYIVKSINEKLDRNEKSMKSVATTEDFVLAVMNNVLSAIRQNEHLQAWYAAQCGFPAMKVAGIHPANVKVPTQEQEKGWSDLDGE